MPNRHQRLQIARPQFQLIAIGHQNTGRGLGPYGFRSAFAAWVSRQRRSIREQGWERWPRLFGQKMLLGRWSPASCGRLTGVAVGFDLPGFYTKRIELGGACGRRDVRWESRQTFPRQATRCATAHRPQIHGVPCSCLTPLVGLRTRVPRSRRRPASCHPGSDGVVARCRSADTWPGWLSHRRRCHRP